jgi:hypothetical protein
MSDLLSCIAAKVMQERTRRPRNPFRHRLLGVDIGGFVFSVGACHHSSSVVPVTHVAHVPSSSTHVLLVR